MREFIKILLIVSLVSALLLLMGCGGKDQGALGPTSPFTFSGGSLPIDGNTYASTSYDDQWEIAVRTSPDIWDGRNDSRVFDMQIQLLDKICGTTYIFEKRGVMPQPGAVVVTNFLAKNAPKVSLYTRVYFTKYSLEQRKIVEGNLQLEMPERMNCRNAQQFNNQSFGDQGAFNDPFFQNNQFGNNNYSSDFPTLINIQLQ